MKPINIIGSIRSMGRVALLLLLAAGTAAAGTVTGTVRNGTTGKPASGVDVILIQLQGGMESVANTKTDAEGKYKLDNAAIGQGPMLIRAVYRGVMFHQPLVPGTSTVDVTVFEPSSDSKIVSVATRVIVLQPNNTSLLVGEEYGLQNQSQPPQAYFDQKGDFNFDVPEGAQLSQVSTWGPSKMPVVQGTINKGDRKYAIAYAFQPGDNGVRLSYEVPYPGNQTTLHLNSAYAVQKILLVAPPTVKVESAGFAPAGNEQGYNLYSRDAVPAGLPFDISVSGTAPAPAASQQQSQGVDPSASAQDPVNGRDSGVTIQAMPNRLDSLKWVLIGGFAALFAVGLVFIWRRPIAMIAGGDASEAVMALPGGGPRAGRKQTAAPRMEPPRTVPASASSGVPAAAPMADVERSLDSLKDKLFRLELRHQAGTISEEEYARERGRTEEILRELLRG